MKVYVVTLEGEFIDVFATKISASRWIAGEEEHLWDYYKISEYELRY